jgi:nucleotide-binding universal stress UspA family protein
MVDCNALSDLGRLQLAAFAAGQSCVTLNVRVGHCAHRRGAEALAAGMRILIATDGSDCSVAALRSVANRPWPEESVTKIISVPEFILFKDPSFLEKHEATDLGQASIDDAKSCVTAGAKILSGSALKFSSEVPTFEERPYRVILNEAESWHADLIVVGSHGWSGFDRVVMGSVSEAVALQATCSVEVIRSKEAG